MVRGAGCDRADECVLDRGCEFYGDCLIVVAEQEYEEEVVDASTDPL